MIARSTGGSYAVSLNAEDFPALRMQLVGLNDKLERSWGPVELAKGAGLGLYRIAVDERGEFVVAGSAVRALCLWKFTQSGQLAWVIPVPSDVHSTVVNPLRVASDGYLLAAAGKDHARDRPSASTRVEPSDHRDLFDILVVKVSAAK